VKKRPLRPDEQRIWAKVAVTVTPGPGRFVPEMPEDIQIGASDPSKKRKTAPTPPHFAPETYRPSPSAPAERSGEKRVRRGRLEISGRLDLHGMTQVQARAALVGFLARTREHGGRCALVITGKGRRDDGSADDRPFGHDGAGVLRRRLPEWLRQPDIDRKSVV